MTADDVRDGATNLSNLDVEDPISFLVSLGLSVVFYLLAPLVAVALAAALLPLELSLLLVVALLVIALRFTGVVPWTVLTIDAVTGVETRTKHRSILRAVRLVRSTNHDRRVQVRWTWR